MQRLRDLRIVPVFEMSHMTIGCDVETCGDCQGLGEDSVGNPCVFCDGHGDVSAPVRNTGPVDDELGDDDCEDYEHATAAALVSTRCMLFIVAGHCIELTCWPWAWRTESGWWRVAAGRC